MQFSQPSDITQSKFERITLKIFYNKFRLCTISKKFIVSLTIFTITLALPTQGGNFHLKVGGAKSSGNAGDPMLRVAVSGGSNHPYSKVVKICASPKRTFFTRARKRAG